MSAFLIAALLTIAVLIAVGLYRVWIGPTVFDRLVAVALVSVNGVVVIVLLGITLQRPVLFFDIALGFALLAFLLPITLGRYFEAQMRDRAHGHPEHRLHHEVPHSRLADRGRALERRYASRLRRQATDANTATAAWSDTTDAAGPGSGAPPSATTPDGGQPADHDQPDEEEPR